MSTKKTNLTPEQENIQNVANEIAQQAGYENAQSMMQALNSDIESGSKVRSAQARTTAADFVNELLTLCFYQHIDSTTNLEVYRWTKMFDDQKIEAGNSKEYMRNIITGGSTFDSSKFVPSTATFPKTRAKVLSLFNTSTSQSNQELTLYGYQFRKDLTILASQWIPYFSSGKLSEFIESQLEQIRTSVEMFKISQVEKVVTDLIGINNNSDNVITDDGTITPIEGTHVNRPENVTKGLFNISKRIRGTASNLFDAFANEIFPEIEKMEFPTSEYAIHGGMTGDKPLIGSKASDLIILLNTKTYTLAKHGVPATVFNYKLVDMNNFASNIFKTGKKLSVPTDGNNGAVTVTTNDLIPENMVVVLHKDAIKHCFWVDETSRQSFVTNLTIQNVSHQWGALAVLPWVPAFVYTNRNLNTTPSSISAQEITMV